MNKDSTGIIFRTELKSGDTGVPVQGTGNRETTSHGGFKILQAGFKKTTTKSHTVWGKQLVEERYDLVLIPD